MSQATSVKKRIRQNAKCQARNRWRKVQVRDAVKDFHTALQTGKQDKMSDALRICYKKLDQVAAHGTIHKNTAARTKARLSKAMNKALA